MESTNPVVAALVAAIVFLFGVYTKQNVDAQKRSDRELELANERTKVAISAGAQAAKEERERADAREQAWLAKLDKVATAQEELDDNVSNIHILMDGMIRVLREREGAAPPATPSPPIRRRTQGGD